MWEVRGWGTALQETGFVYHLMYHDLSFDICSSWWGEREKKCNVSILFVSPAVVECLQVSSVLGIAALSSGRLYLSPFPFFKYNFHSLLLFRPLTSAFFSASNAHHLPVPPLASSRFFLLLAYLSSPALSAPSTFPSPQHPSCSTTLDLLRLTPYRHPWLPSNYISFASIDSHTDSRLLY
ncbi:hypothetical protein E2C01_018952 [Portunus trituberculatus]|uniref:Uncharacterized protein n=1 Tax=Portunus trituberculatus TaxID=210409 RepID=A0A5B7DXK8_PORTR|nr:hypothetical protein [Portunus trituberculatus]